VSQSQAPLHDDEPRDIPLGQRLFDNVFLLMVAGILVMVVLYTGWGLWEVLTLDRSPLP
jgi:hypothetical protein